MSSVAYLLRWWLAAEVIGAFALPLAFRVFGRLPDRGYAFARILGLTLILYSLWIGGTSGLLPFSTGSALLVTLGLGVAGVALCARQAGAMLAWLREARRYVIWSEAVFLVTLLLIGFLRSYRPEIAGTEKPFEYATYSAVARTTGFAPTDPWLSGRPLAYYYGGYVGMDAVARMTATPSSYAFNVALALTGALTAAAIFGLAANGATLLRRGAKLQGTWPLVAGSMAVVLLLIIGNLVGVLEIGAVHGWNPRWVYDHLDIQGLMPGHSDHWYPVETVPGWHLTRLGSDWNFLEFPSFSFLLGDLHPHVLALPYMLLAAGLALALLLAPALPPILAAGAASWWRLPWRAQVSQRKEGREARSEGPLAPPSSDLTPLSAWRGGILVWLLSAITIGGLILIHTWDYPVFGALCAVAIAGRWYRGERGDWREPALCIAGLIGLSLVLYLPFFFGAGSGIKGIQATEVFFKGSNPASSEGIYLPFQHLLLFWTPLMLPASIFICWCLASRRWQALREHGTNALSLVMLLPLAWAITVVGQHGFDGLHRELSIRGWGWLTVITLGVLLTLALCALGGEFFGRGVLAWDEGAETGDAKLFLIAATCIGVLLVLGPELFMVKDSSGSRANSTFKLWYAAWLLLSVAGSVGGLYAFWQWRPRTAGGALLRPVTGAIALAVFAGACLYPIYGSFARTGGFTGPRTLDGLAYLKTSDPDEYGAARWLNAHVADVETILEAVGQSYQEGGRIASRTGLPSVLDWPFHHAQQGVDNATLGEREADVAEIYNTADITRAFTLLARYGVKYVVVGNPERQSYGQQGMAKFDGIGTAVYRTPSVTIYRVGPAPLYAAVP